MSVILKTMKRLPAQDNNTSKYCSPFKIVQIADLKNTKRCFYKGINELVEKDGHTLVCARIYFNFCIFE